MKHRIVDEGLTAQLWTTKELRALHNITKGKLKTLISKQRLFRIFRGMYATCKTCPTIIARGLAKARPDITFEGKTAIEIYLNQPLTFPLYVQVNDHSHNIGLKNLVKFRRTRKTHRAHHNGLPVVPLAHLISDIIHPGRSTAGIEAIIDRDYWLEYPDDLELHMLRPNTVVPAQIIETFETYYKGKLGKQLFATHLEQLKSSRDATRVAILEKFINEVAVVGADSRLEIKCVLTLRRVGFFPTTQAEVGPYRWDLEIEELNLVLDIDSERYHQNKSQAFYADRWKTNDAVLEGKHTMRITGACCDTHLDQIILRLKTLRSRRDGISQAAPGSSIQPAWKWHTKLQQHPAHV